MSNIKPGFVAFFSNAAKWCKQRLAVTSSPSGRKREVAPEADNVTACCLLGASKRLIALQHNDPAKTICEWKGHNMFLELSNIQGRIVFDWLKEPKQMAKYPKGFIKSLEIEYSQCRCLSGVVWRVNDHQLTTFEDIQELAARMDKALGATTVDATDEEELVLAEEQTNELK
jgi:hypothetical protein